MGFGMLGLAGLLADGTDMTRSAQAADAYHNPLASKSPHFPGKAKRVIHLFMNGGPFGGDLLDPKPDLKKYAGQRPKAVQLRTERRTAGLLPSPFAFAPRGQSGVPVSELLPRFVTQPVGAANISNKDKVPGEHQPGGGVDRCDAVEDLPCPRHSVRDRRGARVCIARLQLRRLATGNRPLWV